MKRNIVYITLVGLLYLGLVVVFDFFPRSTISELEKRKLETFPEFTIASLKDGSYTSAISSWFSDSEPFRDKLLTFSMQVKDYQKMPKVGDDLVFIATEGPAVEEPAIEKPNPNDAADKEGYIDSVQEKRLQELEVHVASNGIILSGGDSTVRAMMGFMAGPNAAISYAKLAGYLKETFPQCNVYSMIIPTAVAFYCPEKMEKRALPQWPVIETCIANMPEGCKGVDIYHALEDHKSEDIYLRTDHHWAPLGAFYAAREFAKVAGVPFQELDSYDRHVVHRYVGSMYGYSHDISVKRSPEDFVYWTPRNVEYSTTYTTYKLENGEVCGSYETGPGPYFVKHKDGSGGAYCTFMGSDCKITHVHTSTGNGRRLLIGKDSFGNAIPGYLFYSFEDIHVIDFRYFKKNLKSYIEQNEITDILTAHNIMSCCGNTLNYAYKKFVNQPSMY